MLPQNKDIAWPTMRAEEILLLGESGTGKTCFVDMFLHNEHFHLYDPVEESSQKVIFDGKPYNIQMRDINFTPLRQNDPTLYPSYIESIFLLAGGFVLLYDVNSYESFKHIVNQGYLFIVNHRRTWAKEPGPEEMIYPSGQQRCGCVLVGTKLDLAKKDREVNTYDAEQWANMHGMKHFEIDTFTQAPINEIVQALIKSTIRAHQRDIEDCEREVKRRKVDGLSEQNAADQQQGDTEKRSWTKLRNLMRKAVS